MQRVDKIYDEACARLAAGLAAYALGLPLSDILEAKRGSAQIALARQIAMYAVYVGFGISLARVAVAFNRDRSTVSHACHLIEDRRDDPDFDAWLEVFEETLRRAAGLTNKSRVQA